MPRFFVPAGAVVAGRGWITGADAFHLARSLRARPGEQIVIVDDAGCEHGLRLDAVNDSRVEGTVQWSRPATGEPALRVHVLQALTKDGLDGAVEAMVEAGAAELWPVITERSVSRPDPVRAPARVERWRAIAREAAGLAGRGAVPVVHDVMTLRDGLAALPGDRLLLALAVEAPAPLVEIAIDPGVPVAVVIGPEGGLGAHDLADLEAAGAAEVHLGPRVLRARLAGAVAISALLIRSGELGTPVARAPLTVVRT